MSAARLGCQHADRRGYMAIPIDPSPPSKPPDEPYPVVCQHRNPANELRAVRPGMAHLPRCAGICIRAT
jgi:hypothetical protein